ncbi:uracil-DNA glycosylase family protein [Methanoculleus taiwanensis]|uniref:uracil-DNA glycosylase family protein n=1 Tax=Methanoculleus taiwanensis TaxID=1550565 RepID=UPI000FFF0791|nr:uracil-DNA glycosylase family protein [Methanoculleus taiwanensis]
MSPTPFSADTVRKRYQHYIEEQERLHRRDLRALLRLDIIPSETYAVYERWLPEDGVDMLLIAEAPPWRGVGDPHRYRYFYNPDQAPITGMSREIFAGLGIRGGTKQECLEAFRQRGLFLTDTIKCIVNKDLRAHIPRSLIEYSARTLLADEIGRLDPGTIGLLGSTALHALASIEPYASEFGDSRTIRDAVLRQREQVFRIDGRSVIVSPYPSVRNDRRAITEAFRLLGEHTRRR